MRFLRKAYPFNNDLIHNAKVVFFISVVLGMFLFFFSPFNFNEFPPKEKFTISSIISLITFAVLSFNLIVLPSYFKTIFEIKSWVVWKEILWDTWLFLSVSIGYFVYFRFFNTIFEISTKDIATVIFTSIFVIAILVVLNQNRLVKLNLNDAIELNKRLMSKQTSKNDVILFDSEYKKDEISVRVGDLLLLKSAGNYVEIFFEEKNKIQKHLVRNTLKNFEQKLSGYSCIFKCHRAYLVNLDYVEKAVGEAQGLKLVLKKLDFTIPVSRGYVHKLKEKI